jgi:hypothetical protein
MLDLTLAQVLQHTDIIIISFLTVLITYLIIDKFKREKITVVKGEPLESVEHELLDFIPEIILKSYTEEGLVIWDIVIHNIDVEVIKVLTIKVRGTCLLADNSKFIISSGETLVTNFSISPDNSQKIPFKYDFKSYNPRNIKLGCSFRFETEDGTVQKHNIPILFSRSVLPYDNNKVSKKIA